MLLDYTGLGQNVEDLVHKDVLTGGGRSRTRAVHETSCPVLLHVCYYIQLPANQIESDEYLLEHG